MDNIQRRLEEARTELLIAQHRLAVQRRCHWSVQCAERYFLYWLDRAWEAQCMAQGSL